MVTFKQMQKILKPKYYKELCKWMEGQTTVYETTEIVGISAGNESDAWELIGEYTHNHGQVIPLTPRILAQLKKLNWKSVHGKGWS